MLNLPDRHKSIVRVLIEGNPDTTMVDLDQLVERVDYATTKQAIQHQIRDLIKRGIVIKAGTANRRDRRRRLLELSQAAKSVIMSSKQRVAPAS